MFEVVNDVVDFCTGFDEVIVECERCGVFLVVFIVVLMVDLVALRELFAFVMLFIEEDLEDRLFI